MKKAILPLCLAAAAVSGSTFAATGQSVIERGGYTIYFSTGYASMGYRDLKIPRSGTKITKVSWNYHDYTNGYDNQKVELCYRRQYSNYDFKCMDISSSNSGSVDYFDGLEARGELVLTYTLEGGSYHAYWDYDVKNTITIDYTY
ncbi:flagellar protein FlhE [Pseudoalteromonas rubra]|uniref:Uncharacterized protein n=1 Tax=Pseudoalteromonas rubra TaxID=43658 RepID=A0A5S3WR95_9GAMM|nr:flagellar protein FlhE [Pseudoalteromonas rubra]TMP31034.1 hypothetical protein CWB98_22770 [Pseudoalteromonas rubra]